MPPGSYTVGTPPAHRRHTRRQFAYQAQGQGTLTASVPIGSGSGSGAITESGISVTGSGSETGTATCEVDGTPSTVDFSASQNVTASGSSIPGTMTVNLTPITNSKGNVTDFDMGVDVASVEAGAPQDAAGPQGLTGPEGPQGFTGAQGPPGLGLSYDESEGTGSGTSWHSDSNPAVGWHDPSWPKLVRTSVVGCGLRSRRGPGGPQAAWVRGRWSGVRRG
jgi:hypothetical protein